jgi:hypothetical protein
MGSHDRHRTRRPIRHPLREPDSTEVIAAAARIESRRARSARQSNLPKSHSVPTALRPISSPARRPTDCLDDPAQIVKGQLGWWVEGGEGCGPGFGSR